MIDSIAGRLPGRLARWAPQFQAAMALTGVDAFLLAALVDRESLGGEALTPRGPRGRGDEGRACGLGQIDTRFHATFIDALGPDGHPLWEDPTFNLLYAATLLRMNYGKLGDWLPAVAAYNASLERVRAAWEVVPATATFYEKVNALDAVTTGGNYVSDVYTRRSKFVSTSPETT